MEVIKKKMTTLKNKLEVAEKEALQAEEELDDCIKKTEDVRLIYEYSKVYKFL